MNLKEAREKLRKTLVNRSANDLHFLAGMLKSGLSLQGRSDAIALLEFVNHWDVGEIDTLLLLNPNHKG